MPRRSDSGLSALSRDARGDAVAATLENRKDQMMPAMSPVAPSGIDPFNSIHASRVAYQTVLGVLHGFATTLCIARNLADSDQEVDLSGLHETAGLLCARALDLRPEHGRQLIPRLRSVLEDLDALHTSLVPTCGEGPNPRA